MYSTTKIIKTISLIGACVLAATTARAVDPPPDGGYPNGNTAEGEDALFSLTTGFSNTAIGYRALYGNTTGLINTAIGFQTLFTNTTGAANTTTGYEALYSNTTGSSNTATGVSALLSNTTGNDNTAAGVSALLSNTTGSENTATGAGALALNITGVNNTATGVSALNANITGSNNSAAGFNGLRRNTTGEGNTANGFRALVRNTTGNDNIALGNNAGENLTTGNNNIEIGNRGVPGEANTIRIGKQGTQSATFIAGISGATAPTGVPVLVDSNGQLGTITSSVRFKDEIKPMDKASEAILALRPVTFRYKKELDPAGVSQFGLVAEQVEKVDPDLVARDDQGRPYTVRYEAVNAMLLNEFLKEHRKVEEQSGKQQKLEAIAAQQQNEIAALTAALKAQAAQIQKVSDLLKTQAPVPRVVAND
jgi:hypothetical protein